MLISSLVVTYSFVALAQRGRGGGERQRILKQHLAPLQSYLHQHLLNSIAALGAGELKEEAKLSLGQPTVLPHSTFGVT